VTSQQEYIPEFHRLGATLTGYSISQLLYNGGGGRPIKLGVAAPETAAAVVCEVD
jgi:hypothetical protein